jgi:predicted transcriptional regulator
MLGGNRQWVSPKTRWRKLLAFDILELYPQPPREQGLSGLPYNTSMVTVRIHHLNTVGLEIGENSRRFDLTSKGKSGFDGAWLELQLLC